MLTVRNNESFWRFVFLLATFFHLNKNSFADAKVDPYKDMGINIDWQNTPPQPENITDLQIQSGLSDFTLAFLVAQSANNCSLQWGGAEQAVGWGKKMIDNFMSNGNGTLTLSFGGADGTYIQDACSSVEDLETQINSVIKTYGVNALDFDIEGAGAENIEGITRLAKALSKLQTKNSQLSPRITLAVLPSGLTENGLQILNIMKSHHVKFNVNVMAMDFGNSAAPNPNQMDQYIIQSANSTVTQLKQLYPNSPEAEIWQKLTVTMMIGVNDVHPEYVSQAQAVNVTKFCADKGAGVSYWSIDRDAPCKDKWASASCSGENENGVEMQTKKYQYAKQINSAYTNNTNSKLNARDAAKQIKFEQEIRKQQSNAGNKNFDFFNKNNNKKNLNQAKNEKRPISKIRIK